MIGIGLSRRGDSRKEDVKVAHAKGVAATLLYHVFVKEHVVLEGDVPRTLFNVAIRVVLILGLCAALLSGIDSFFAYVRGYCIHNVCE